MGTNEGELHYLDGRYMEHLEERDDETEEGGGEVHGLPQHNFKEQMHK